jgi:nucleosome assembly protein 1-like 1
MAPNEEIDADTLPDPPIVVELKKIDDEYLAVEREYEKEVEELQRKYTEKQKPFLDKRSEILQKADNEADAPVTGTPALRGFWLKALRNHPAFEEEIEEWDEPVLEYLSDIKKENIDPMNSEKGFKFELHFVENAYFENKVLTKEYHTKEGSPYTGDIEVTEIVSSPIEWKAGKDVTVESVKKKVKGGGAKKAKQANKEKIEPRSSFFRHFFRNLKEGGPLPDDIDPEEMRGMCEDSDDEGDEEQIISFMMENDHEAGCALRDNIIPFAIRWYTGEAAPEEDDDDDEGDEEEDDDDDDEEEDDDDDDESEDEPPARGKKGAAKGKAKAGGEGEKKEECKQQ